MAYIGVLELTQNANSLQSGVVWKLSSLIGSLNARICNSVLSFW